MLDHVIDNKYLEDREKLPRDAGGDPSLDDLVEKLFPFNLLEAVLNLNDGVATILRETYVTKSDKKVLVEDMLKIWEDHKSASAASPTDDETEE